MKKMSLKQVCQKRDEVRYRDSNESYLGYFTDAKYDEPSFEVMPSISAASLYFLFRGFDLRERYMGKCFDVVENSKDNTFLRMNYLESVYRNGVCCFAIEKDDLITESFVVFVDNECEEDYMTYLSALRRVELLDTVDNLFA